MSDSCEPMDCSMPGFLVFHYLLEFAQTHIHHVDNAIQPSHPLSPSSPSALNPSQHQLLFQWVSSSYQVAKILLWVGISPSNRYSALISFRSDWFDFLSVQSTIKSLLQHHNSKASVLPHSDFFVVQLSHQYMTTGKTIALTVQNLVSKMMSLLFNILSRFVVVFLPWCKGLLISWLQKKDHIRNC